MSDGSPPDRGEEADHPKDALRMRAVTTIPLLEQYDHPAAVS
jgi:hypothetical protein